MRKLEFKLKQHTPLLHFQPMQEGATLRASEVKPKLDKFLLKELGKGDYDNGVKKAKENNWLIGDSKALNYKMRIVSSGLQPDISMAVREAVKRGAGTPRTTHEKLYTTPNYPDARNSLIMGNIGGRPRNDVLNFVFYNNNIMTITSTNDELATFIDDNIDCFINCTNFGNRTSKGFGSFQVVSYNGREAKRRKGDYIALISADIRSNDRSQVLKVVFTLINFLWKKLKANSGLRGTTQKGAVILDRKKLYMDEERIPSPIYAKPFVYQSENCYKVEIGLYVNKEVVSLLRKTPSFYQTKIKALSHDSVNKFSEINNLTIN